MTKMDHPKHEDESPFVVRAPQGRPILAQGVSPGYASEKPASPVGTTETSDEGRWITLDDVDGSPFVVRAPQGRPILAPGVSPGYASKRTCKSPEGRPKRCRGAPSQQ